MIRLHTLGTLRVVGADGSELHAIAVQPKRIALLAYLALTSPRGFQRRDQVLLVFWPELTQDRARNALRQAVHHLRQHTGDDVIVSRGTEEIGIRADALWCDCLDFERAVAEERFRDAVALYHGPLLRGFHFAGASPEFEEWLEQRRATVRGALVSAAERAAHSSELAGDLEGAMRWLDVALDNSDCDERLFRRLASLLESAGERSTALERYERFATQLARRFDTQPSADTRSLMARIRRGATSADVRRSGDRVPSISATARADESPSTITIAPRSPRAPRWRLLALGAGVTLAALIGMSLPRIETLAPSTASMSVVATTPAGSAIAKRLYEEGVRAYMSQDPGAADRLLSAAVAADSTLAMAAYYAARAKLAEEHPNMEQADSLLRLAVRQSKHVADRDRLVIEETSADFGNEPERLAFAETLAIRYPRYAAGQLSLGKARLWSGEFLPAVAALQAAFRLDSASAGDTRADCTGCDAIKYEMLAYRHADSLPAAVRVARAWTERAPRSPVAWRGYGVMLAAQGRFADARRAYDESANHGGEGANITRDMAELAIRAGDFPTADRLLAGDAAGGTTDARQDAVWLHVISLRTQGKLHQALDEAALLRELAQRASLPAPARWYAALPYAQVLLEMGRARAAATLLDSTLRGGGAHMRAGLSARHFAWTATLRSEALGAAGDTTALAASIDSIARAGIESAYGRDRALSHHVRGVLLTRRGDLAGAAAEFQRALFSPTMGYTRTNEDLAQVLIALGRPREAIAILRPAFGGELGASAMYVTRTDLHETIARAFDAAGERDSAVVHYAAVVSALRDADAELAPRRAAAAARVAALTGVSRAR